MKKALAVLRSLVLLVILYFVLVSTPWEVFGSGDTMMKVQHLRGLVKATGIAVAFIAIETGISWIIALRKPKGAAPAKPARDAKSSGAAPPPGAEQPGSSGTDGPSAA
jgi:hypothetical protein